MKTLLKRKIDVKVLVTSGILLFGALHPLSAIIIEAETYDRMSGVSIKTSPAAEGGAYVSDIDHGDYVEYDISGNAGLHTLSFNVSTMNKGTIKIRENDSFISSVYVASTGNSWKTLTVDVLFKVSGNKTIKLDFAGDGANLLSIDWFGLNVNPFISADEYTKMSGIEVEQSNDDGGANNLASISNEDWSEYFIDSDVGYYIMSFRVLSSNPGASVYIYENGARIGILEVANTSGIWQTVNTAVIFQSAGIKTLRLRYLGDSEPMFKLNWFAYEKPMSLEAEDFTLEGYTVIDQTDASEGKVASLTGEDGKMSIEIKEFEGNYDLKLYYFLDEGGDYEYELYINDDVVDAWQSDDYSGQEIIGNKTRVSHAILRLALSRDDILELRSYNHKGACGDMDNLELLESSDFDPQSQLVFGPAGNVTSLVLNGTDMTSISSESAITRNEFAGTNSLIKKDLYLSSLNEKVVEFGDEYGFMRMLFRIEAYEYHVRLKLVGLEGMPRNDKSLSLTANIHFNNSMNYLLIDDKIRVEKSSGTLTIHWPYLADRRDIPGGAIAIYRNGTSEENAAAIREIEAGIELEANVDLTDTLNVETDTTVLNEDILREFITLYPNPVNKELFITAPTGSKVELYNIHGQLMYNNIIYDTQFAVDMSTYDYGIYILRLENKSGIRNYKVLKK